MKKLQGRLGNLLIPTALLLFVAVFLLLGKFYWDYPSSVIMFPVVVGTLAMGSALWLIIRSLIVPVNILAEEGESVSENEDPRCSLPKRLLWIASVYPLCYLLGLIAGLVLFSLAYTSYHRLPMIQRVITAVIIFALIYIGFYKLLGVSSLPIAPLWMRH